MRGLQKPKPAPTASYCVERVEPFVSSRHPSAVTLWRAATRGARAEPRDGGLVVRPLSEPDVPAAARAAASAFGMDISDSARRLRWEARVAHPLATDPEGCFVAEQGGEVMGVAQALMREGLWILSLLAIDPGVQSAGAGRLLMKSALGYGPPQAPGLIVSSDDPRAFRLYARSGFALRPTFEADGVPRRRRPPVRAGVPVREAGEEALDELAGVSRHVRGAAHTQELRYALRRGALLLRAGDRGYVALQPGMGVWVLAALDEEAAAALLWTALDVLGDRDEIRIRWISGEQPWAIDVAVRAGLRLRTYGGLAVRGAVGPLAPFIPSGPFA